MGLVFGQRKALPAVTDRAAVVLDRVGLEELEPRMSRPGLLDPFQTLPEHSLMTGRTAVHPIQVFRPDLLDPGGNLRRIDRAEVLGHDGLELALVVLPVFPLGACEDHRYGDQADHGNDEESQKLALWNMSNPAHVGLTQNGIGCVGQGCQGQKNSQLGPRSMVSVQVRRMNATMNAQKVAIAAVRVDEVIFSTRK